MIKKFALVVSAAVVTSLAVVPIASASTHRDRHDGIEVRTPRAVTAFNHRKAHVLPAVRARAGFRERVDSRTTTAWHRGRRVATGKGVWLRPGTYLIQTRVTYQTYRFVTRSRRVPVWRPGGMPDGSRCVVTQVDDWNGDGVGDDIAASDCTNRHYPGQTVHDRDTLPNVDRTSYAVGDVVYSDYVWFKGYEGTRIKHYRVKQWSKRRTYRSPKHWLRVKDGGFRRVYSYSESHRTPFFTVPYHWHAAYVFDCSNFGTSGNWIVDLHQQGSSIIYDRNLHNQIRYRGSGGWNFAGSGTFRFQVITECDWQMVVRWH